MSILDTIREKLNITAAPKPKSGGGKKSNTTTIKRIGYVYSKGSGGAGRTNFEEPEFDLSEINTAYNTDSFIRQSVDKYVNLIFKSGWDIVGKNQSAVDYINLRIAAMADATGNPFENFLMEIAEDMVKLSNVFIVKARQSSGYTYPQGISATGVTNTSPITGYFVLPADTITIARDANGTILAYQQMIDSNKIQIKPSEMLHLHWKRERGKPFGTPFLLPVLDDVKILRQCEEDVVRLIYRHLQPLIVYKVGKAEPGYEATPEEIDEVTDKINNMELDAGLVIPERHDIDVVGIGDATLDINDYLAYFRSRVFTGLGVSDTVMGISDTANRATADNATAQMNDSIQAYQNILSIYIENLIFYELLKEGGFDPLLNIDDRVCLQFKEIDVTARTKVENQVIQLWLNNLITFEEARLLLGYEGEADEARLYGLMVEAQLNSSNNNTGDNTATNTTSTTKSTTKKAAASLTEALDNSSTHQQTINITTSRLCYHWTLTRSDVVDLIKQYYMSGQRDYTQFTGKEIAMTLGLTRTEFNKLTQSHLKAGFMAGADSARRDANSYNTILNYESHVTILMQHNSQFLDKLFDGLNKALVETIKRSDHTSVLAAITGVFQSFEYRLDFIADTQYYAALNYGYAKCAQLLGHETVTCLGSSECERCASHDSAQFRTSDIYPGAKSAPPYHSKCHCTLSLTPKEGN